MQFYREMRASGIQPTVNTFTSLIDACGKANELEQALHILEAMLMEGVCPNERTFTSLITACVQTEQPKLQIAVAVLQQMVSCDPNAVCNVPYNHLIRTCGKAMEIDLAFIALQSVLISGVVPQLSTFNFLIEHAGKVSSS